MAITINGGTNTVAGLAVGGLPDGTVDADTLASGAVTRASMPTGSILQVVANTSETQISNTSQSNDLIACSITPTATSSNILITFNLWIGTDSNPNGGIKLTRGGTAIGATSVQAQSASDAFWSADDWWYGTDANTFEYTIAPFPWTFLDTGISTTSSTEYKVTSTWAEIHYNRIQDSDSGAKSRSTITLLEVAG